MTLCSLWTLCTTTNPWHPIPPTLFYMCFVFHLLMFAQAAEARASGAYAASCRFAPPLNAVASCCFVLNSAPPHHQFLYSSLIDSNNEFLINNKPAKFLGIIPKDQANIYFTYYFIYEINKKWLNFLKCTFTILKIYIYCKIYNFYIYNIKFYITVKFFFF